MSILTLYKVMADTPKGASPYSFTLNNPHTLNFLRGPILLLASGLVGLAYLGNQISYQQFALSLLALLPGFIFNHFFSHLQTTPKHNIIPLGLDFLTSFFLVFINGGSENPLYFILLLHIFIGPFYLQKKAAIIFIGLVTSSLMIIPISPYSFKQFILPLFPELNYPFIPLVLAGVIFGLFAMWFVREIKTLNQYVQNSILMQNRVDRYRSLGLLTAGICHELGTPLQTIEMRLKQLYKKTQKKDGSNPWDKDFEVLLRNSSKVTNSVKKLNKQAHIQDDQIMEFCDPVKTLEAAISEFKKYHPELVEIKLQQSLKDLSFIKLSELHYTKCLLEIFENAKEAGANYLEVALSENHGKAIVDIKDNGQGFSKEVLKHLGSPFVSSKERGTGLGLYHLQNSIDYIGGKFRILSTSSQGSRLQIQIPLTLPGEQHV